ncbi:MAG TPA: protein kinase [Gemmatimonadaceae bacterium]|nr:protein kinase [Gemmatimonadaceae bacterium]
MTGLLDILKAGFAGEYAIERELPGGGMSRLFLARDHSLRRQVVIKILPPELTHEVSAARFVRESEITAQLQHPHILPILAAGNRGDFLYYIMPYVPGESLRSRLRREGRLGVQDAARMLSEIADALAYAHGEGVIHRDIKPENILLEGKHAVIADFGIAHALHGAETAERLTVSGMAVGTVGYMAPEQAAGERAVDGRADIYALGIVGYEMLAGRPPFEGTTAQALLVAHLTEEAAPLFRVRPEVPRIVSDALARAMAKAPQDRWQTADLLRDALDEGRTPTTQTRGFRLPVRSRRWQVATLCLTALAVAGAAAVTHGMRNTALDPNVVAVAPFDVIAADAETRTLWREGIVDVLARKLDGAGPLRSVSSAVVLKRWKGRADAASASALGQRTGAGLVVYGTVLGVGPDSVELSATLYDVRRGVRIGIEVERRDATSQMTRLADSVSLGLLRELGRTRPIGAVRSSSLGSTSMPALKAFLRGEQLYRRTAWDSALAQYELAFSTDTTFALAFRRFGLTRYWQRGGLDSLVTATRLRAGAFNRGLSPRDSLLLVSDSLAAAMSLPDADGRYWGRARRLFASLDVASRIYKDDPEVWAALGEARHHYGYGAPVRVTDASVLEAFDRAIALDSAFAPAYIHAVEHALTHHGDKAARRYARAYLALDPSDAEAEGIRLVDRLLAQGAPGPEWVGRQLTPEPRDVLANAWFAVRRWADTSELAIRIAHMLLQSGETERDVRTWESRLASALAYRGHLAEARSVARSPSPRFVSELALLDAFPEDSAGALFGEWLARGTGAPELALPWWGRRGDVASITRAADVAQGKLTSEDAAVRRSAHHVLGAARAYLALARHDTAQALREFSRLSDTLCLGCYGDRLAYAQVLMARGELRTAAQVLGERLYSLLSPLEVLFLVEQGEVAERLGDRRTAVQAYRRVVSTWARADPSLQAFVAKASRALERMGAGSELVIATSSAR